MRGSVVVIFCLSLISCIAGAPAKNKITKVPGFSGTTSFAQYGGYLGVNDGEKKLFYWFAESQGNPSKDPLVLWLNGGPGCSSFDGFVYEHGPYTFEEGGYGKDQKLKLNPYSWNKAANMIYLDSPAGVGMSYSDNSSDLNTNDQITAKDSHNFLLNWLDAYPEFKNNSFYVSGESYAGVYVPTLANQIMIGNKDPKKFINMKGILVGNGVTDRKFDGNAYIPFTYGHSLISQTEMKEIDDACHGNYWNADHACRTKMNLAHQATRDLNIYDIYEPCYGLTNQPNAVLHNETNADMTNPEYRLAERFRDADPTGVPCMDARRATQWLNYPPARTAMHAEPISHIGKWEICGGIHYTRTVESTIKIHKNLIAHGYKVLIYSGDADMCVPHTGSESWTRSLGYPIDSSWRAWKTPDHQVAGYVVSYKTGLTYATILGSGHTVPQYKPVAALHFFQNFINGKPF